MSRRLQRKKTRREILRGLLAQCTEKQQEVFKKMYGSVDEMNNKQVPWATIQCERTIEVNSPEYKLKKQLDNYIKECECMRCLEEDDKENKPYTLPITATRMVLCPECGNKRCPHATDHRNDCTNSNDPGQKGSIYE